MSTVTGIATQQVGGYYFSITASASTTTSTNRVCLIGDFEGTNVTADSPFLAGTTTAVGSQTGTGSTLDLMYRAFRAKDASTEVWILPVNLTENAPENITASLATLGDKAFSSFGGTFYDAATLAAIDSYLSEEGGRWSPTVQLFGHYWTATLDPAATAVNGYGNSKHTTVLDFPGTASPLATLVGDFLGTMNAALAANPTGSLNYYTLNVDVPALADQLTLAQQNSLLSKGVSTAKVDDSGTIYTTGVRTNYTTDGVSPDSTWSRVTTMYNLANVVQQVKASLAFYLTGHYAILEDGSQIPGGSFYVTPSVVLGTALATLQRLADAGQVTNMAKTLANSTASISDDGYGVNLDLDITLPGEFECIYNLFTVSIA